MAAKAKKVTPTKARASALTQEPVSEKDVQVAVFKGHKGAIHRVAMTKDGKFAITSGSDGTVRRWELDGEGKSQILLKAEKFFGLAMTADGSIGAVSDNDGNVTLFEIDSLKELLKMTVKGNHDSDGVRVEQKDLIPADGVRKHVSKKRDLQEVDLVFTAANRELLSATPDGKLRRWDIKTGACLAQCRLTHEVGLLGVTASEDGSRIVGVAHQLGLAAWSGTDDEAVKIFKEPIDPNVPISLPNDERFAFTGTLDNKITKWNIVEGRRVAVFEGHSGPVRAVVVTSDGRFCVSGDRIGVIRLWAVETGHCLAILRGHKMLQDKNSQLLNKLGEDHSNYINGLALTPDARRVASVGNDGTLRIWDIPESILARADSLKKRGYMNAKVVLLGDSGVGKTGLALRLWHDHWEKTESTHGMEIHRLVLPQEDGELGVEREVWLWDLAGQPDYRLTHQLFMEQTSLALLVFDPQELDVFGTVGYWQSALRKVANADNIAGILVAARCDRPGLRLTMDEVHGWAVARSLHGPILTAAKLKRHPGTAELRTLIATLLPWDTMEFRSTMENFPALKDAILATRDTKGAGVVVTPTELESRVRKTAPYLKFTTDDLRAVTGLLAGEGVLHALPYGDFVVLQPSWVNCYASTLVKLAGEAENQLGHVPLAAR